ncbi:rhodanese-related sulfurtransferase [Sanyastnella coralliicola]|uniref:oxygen-dependent tRNA uridine(34) hydroxylase TrhO n=1 Tax=Sanyastnella coralliicola TaxID=3069118 RepID=UPI0027BB12B1|nr:rhodanese-related sulfurtransferase [Longitalea sp. SCSIO 12813]
MKKLYNKVDRRELMKRMEESTVPRTTISFYKYARIQNPDFFRDFLYVNWEELGVFGRTYVASEGVNAQISIPSENVDAFREHLYSVTFLDGIRLNISVDDDGKSFYKLKIKVRDKIVADGLDDESFDVTQRGKHVNAEEFNELTSDPDTILVDMRNHYESEVGHFKGAILPDVDTFREELDMVTDMLEKDKDRKVVMYCTGGIRCEKASAWFKHQGYDNVYQLNGGIIEYTRQVREADLENRYVGKNFVFDERRAERITDDVISLCHQCGEPCDDHTNCVNVACNLLFIQCEKCKAEFNNCCSTDCKEVHALPEEEQKELRKGKNNSNKIFRKGRSESLKFQDSSKKKAQETAGEA